MIDTVLTFIRDELNAYLRIGIGEHFDASRKVEFVNGSEIDPLNFASEKVSMLMTNVERDNTLRSPDRHRRGNIHGTSDPVYPDVYLNLYVLFVANFREYKDSLNYLSRVIRFFQSNRIIDHQSLPVLDEAINHLTIELVTLSFAEQNEIWGVLRKSYHPSVMYKVKMLVFRESNPSLSIPVQQREYDYNQIGRENE